MSYRICVVQDICPITVQMKVSPCWWNSLIHIFLLDLLVCHSSIYFSLITLLMWVRNKRFPKWLSMNCSTCFKLLGIFLEVDINFRPCLFSVFGGASGISQPSKWFCFLCINVCINVCMHVTVCICARACVCVCVLNSYCLCYLYMCISEISSLVVVVLLNNEYGYLGILYSSTGTLYYIFRDGVAEEAQHYKNHTTNSLLCTD